jgi:hypothetical protein
VRLWLSHHHEQHQAEGKKNSLLGYPECCEFFVWQSGNAFYLSFEKLIVRQLSTQHLTDKYTHCQHP